MIQLETRQPPNTYPTSDGKPMAETDWHRELMLELIATLQRWFADEPAMYVSGNLLIFFEKGNKRRHISPDVFVVRGIGNHRRNNLLLWEEGGRLDVAIELTSKTTMREDLVKKHDLYLNALGVKEYFLFDPKEDYLKPSFQAFRRVGREFRPIKPVAGRYPSKILGLHLERAGWHLRLWDPATGERVPTPVELAAAAEARADQQANQTREAEARANEEAARAKDAEAEIQRLRRLLEQRPHSNGHGT